MIWFVIILTTLLTHRYIDVLIQLTRVEGTKHGKLLASQMMDVTIRVKAIRPYAVQCLVSSISEMRNTGARIKNIFSHSTGSHAKLSTTQHLWAKWSLHFPNFHSFYFSQPVEKLSSIFSVCQCSYGLNGVVVLF